jgi:hypothetical protein
MTGRIQKHQVSVDKRLSRYTFPHRDYRGRCYEKSFRYVFTHMETVPELRLVHGAITVVGVYMNHAWVEFPQGIVFDATTQEFYDRDAYYRLLNAQAERVYTSQEVAHHVAETNHWGPWHEPAQPDTPRRALKGSD